ncbi:MAG TPA: class I SAM-dependent methyltransferase [Candidatus Methylomirabilis sp.]|nr:class I SAM-dependent methyltransferase [Candidatus Methylomirabilis sp.]
MSAACNLCGGTSLSPLEAAADGVRTVRCSRCQLIFLDPFPAFELAAHYDGEYYRPWREEQAGRRAALWGRRADFLGRFARPGSLLDVGCGDGSFLLAARERGWRVTGTEVSRWAARMLPLTHDFPVLEGDLLEIDLPEGSYDAVTLWHVLEHLQRPLQTLQRARSLLRESGVLIAAVPNAGFSLFRLVYPMARLRRLRYYTPGERELHLHHFTADTLLGMLDRAGFQVRFRGIDESALRPVSILLEKAAKLVQALSGASWSEALVVVAAKTGAP